MCIVTTLITLHTISRAQLVIVLETEAPYSFYTLLSMQQIVKFKEGSKAPITYLSDVIDHDSTETASSI